MARMTNGEMIQKVFDCEVCEPLPEDDIIHVIFPDKNDSAIGFDWSWWNMEYKDPTAKNNLGVDAISRADVLDSIAIMCSVEELDVDFAKLLVLQRTIKALPPVTPQEPRKEHWTCDRANVRCSSCGRGYKDFYGKARIANYNYCPNCGAKMVEPQESDIEKRKPCINCEDGCEEWAGCPCVYYKAESEVKK